MRVIYWLAIFIVLLIIEIATMGLTSIWFAGGALIAFCAGLVGFGLGVQIGVFAQITFLTMVRSRRRFSSSVAESTALAKDSIIS